MYPLVHGVCLAGLGLWTTLTAQASDAQVLVKKADEAEAANRPRVAIRALRDAHWALYRLDSKARRLHKDLIKTISARLSKHDKESSRLLRLQKKYVDGLIKLMALQQGRKRLVEARELQGYIDTISSYILSPGQRVPVIDTGAAASGGDGLAYWFAGHRDPYSHRWQVTKKTVQGPDLKDVSFDKKGMGMGMLLGGRQISGDFEAELELDLRRVLRAGLVFGAKHGAEGPPSDLYLAELSIEDHGAVLHRLQNNKFSNLAERSGTKALNLVATRLTLRIRGKKGEILFGPDRKSLRFELPEAPRGTFGIYTVLTKKRRGPVVCRDLRVKKLTPLKAEK